MEINHPDTTTKQTENQTVDEEAERIIRENLSDPCLYIWVVIFLTIGVGSSAVLLHNLMESASSEYVKYGIPGSMLAIATLCTLLYLEDKKKANTNDPD